MYWLSWTEPEPSAADRRTISNRPRLADGMNRTASGFRPSKSVLEIPPRPGASQFPLHRSGGEALLFLAALSLNQLGNVGNIDFEANTEVLGGIPFRVREDLGGRNYKSRLSLRGEAIFPALDPESAPAITGRRFVGEIDSAFAVLAGHLAHDKKQAICIGLSDHGDIAFVRAGVVFSDLLLGLICARIAWPLVAEEQT